MIKHILFDLDGTLLPMIQDEFVECYLSLLVKHFVKWDFAPGLLTKCIWKGVEAMVLNDGTLTNEEVFWDCFTRLIHMDRERMEPELLDFYNGEFNQVIKVTQPSPYAAEIIRTLKNTGIKVYLATNPIFPRCATLNRIKWAGLNAADFKEITTYETYHSSKPNPLYFKELMERFHLQPKECLMVGNDVYEDLIIQKLDVKTYLVSDCLENKKNLPLTADYAGSLKDFAEKVKLGTGFFESGT